MPRATAALPRRRLTPEASRDAALEAARALLLEDGPQAVTLKAVATRVGRTHANLLHHFGSADGLQQALIERMTAAIVATIRDAVRRSRAERDPAELVDVVFDAFGAGGAGALASWMILTGNRDALDPVLTAIHDLVEELARDEERPDAPIRDETLQLVLAALGDALLGAAMARALELPRGRARELAGQMLLRDHGSRAEEEVARTTYPPSI
ncbi:TetR family transcriptional regulator [Sphingomonas yunnanensis]|uniref:TetR/AcrR family transcriptional regulator n=1 Tax=Sphingomonas yunnanensis TaxID=310400 RepID=UPI001CA67E20|nr:TetR family transcriptional regulator [Sphingomonas yunnanensis]MBY9065228.1 TetR family transcriptional regulator [Sphingomonas yunnanensis]